MNIRARTLSLALSAALNDVEELTGMCKAQILQAARDADLHGIDVAKFVTRLAGLDWDDRNHIMHLVASVWIQSDRKTQLRNAVINMPKGTFDVATLVAVCDHHNDIDFLVDAARETYRLYGIFLEGVEKQALDRIWRTRVQAFLQRSDYQRAYEELRRAIRGFAPEKGQQSDAFEEVRHEQGGASISEIERLIALVHSTMVYAGILKSITTEALSHDVQGYQRYAYICQTMNGPITKTNTGNVPAFGISQRLFGSYIRAQGMILSLPGHQLLAMAKSFSKTNWID